MVRSCVRGKAFLLFILQLACICGCIPLGPKYRPPEIGIELPDRYRAAPKGALPLPERWWSVFNDPQIDQLVEEVIKSNWDLKKAAARILELEAAFSEARAERLPKFDLSASTARQRMTVQLFFPHTGTKTSVTDSYDLTFAASFELDLWGRLRKASEAARFELLAEEENRRALAQSLVAEAISLYFRARTLERRLLLASERLEIDRDILIILQKRYLRGLLSITEVKAASRVVKADEVTLSSLKQELEEVLCDLSLLLGRYPHPFPLEGGPRDYVEGLQPVPLGLPSELLLRRPDLRAAEDRLKALTARVGVARALSFPRISLTGSHGYSSEDLEDLFRPESLIVRVAAGIVAPLFEGGKLKAAERAAWARLRQAEAEYAKAVLQAFYEVEVALERRRKLFERRRKLMASIKEAQEIEDLLRKRYRRGLVDITQLLEAEKERLRAEEDLLLLDLAILTNRVSLHRALGGGWINPLLGRETGER